MEAPFLWWSALVLPVTYEVKEQVGATASVWSCAGGSQTAEQMHKALFHAHGVSASQLPCVLEQACWQAALSSAVLDLHVFGFAVHPRGAHRGK